MNYYNFIGRKCTIKTDNQWHKNLGINQGDTGIISDSSHEQYAICGLKKMVVQFDKKIKGRTNNIECFYLSELDFERFESDYDDIFIELSKDDSLIINEDNIMNTNELSAQAKKLAVQTAFATTALKQAKKIVRQIKKAQAALNKVNGNKPIEVVKESIVETIAVAIKESLIVESSPLPLSYYAVAHIQSNGDAKIIATSASKKGIADARTRLRNGIIITVKFGKKGDTISSRQYKVGALTIYKDEPVTTEPVKQNELPAEIKELPVEKTDLSKLDISKLSDEAFFVCAKKETPSFKTGHLVMNNSNADYFLNIADGVIYSRKFLLDNPFIKWNGAYLLLKFQAEQLRVIPREKRIAALEKHIAKDSKYAKKVMPLSQAEIEEDKAFEKEREQSRLNYLNRETTKKEDRFWQYSDRAYGEYR